MYAVVVVVFCLRLCLLLRLDVALLRPAVLLVVVFSVDVTLAAFFLPVSRRLDARRRFLRLLLLLLLLRSVVGRALNIRRKPLP